MVFKKILSLFQDLFRLVSLYLPFRSLSFGWHTFFHIVWVPANEYPHLCCFDCYISASTFYNFPRVVWSIIMAYCHCLSGQISSSLLFWCLHLNQYILQLSVNEYCIWLKKMERIFFKHLRRVSILIEILWLKNNKDKDISSNNSAQIKVMKDKEYIAWKLIKIRILVSILHCLKI